MKVLITLFLLIGCYTYSYASLTATYVPNAKTGGTSPSLQNGSIIDTGTSSGFGNVGIGSTAPGQALDVQGTLRASLGIINSAGTTGAMICLTAAHQLGHCTAAASCSSTCTCTCAAN